MAQERLQKILARAGVASRRKCEELILQGLVTVNDKVIDALPAFADPDRDIITAGGRRIREERKLYFLLNKPKGVVCTNDDPQGRVKAIDIIGCKERIFCVGRLDADTTGLIILTNDSELANKLTHPRYRVDKTYVAKVKGHPSQQVIEQLRRGVWLAEGRTERARVDVLHSGYRESMIGMTISQGLNRQVRRMLAKVGLDVKSLKRNRIGKIDDKGLGAGRFRLLTHREVAYLKRISAD